MQKVLSSTALALLISASAALAQQTPAEPAEQRKQQNQTQNQTDKPAQPPAASQTQNQQSGSPSTQSQDQNKDKASQPSRAQQPSDSGSAQSQKAEPDRKPQAQQPSDSKTGSSQTETKSGQPSQAQQPGTAGSQSQRRDSQRQDSQRQDNRRQDSQRQDNRRQENQSASVNLNDQQRSRISQVIAQQRVRSVTNVNFNVSVGTSIPRGVRLYPLPASVIAIVPQYRGYSYIVVRDEIVIVEPRTYRIVAVLPQGGSSRAATSAPRDRERFELTAEQRARIRGGVQRRQIVDTRVVVGQRIPADIELYEFPESVYVEVPTVREYRYYSAPSGTILVDPRERRVIEIIE